MHHPGVARVRCSDCQVRAYDMETGEAKTFQAGPDSLPQFYTLGHVAPCKTGWQCPKGSPEQEHESRLSDKNDRVLQLYHHCQAVGAAAIGPIDPLLAELLSIVHGVFTGFERAEHRRESNLMMAAIQRTVRIA